MTLRTRALPALVAGALALPLMAAPASAAGEATPPAVQDINVFCSTPNAPQFSDVQSGDTFALAIRCLATADIVQGGPGGRPADQYGPGLSVRRGQMATFIAVLLDAADARDRNRSGDTFGGQVQPLPAYDNNNRFSDVPNGDVHVASINRLAAAGIVLGGPGGQDESLYSPNGLVSRAQMATFINRAVAFAQNQPPSQAGQGSGYTTDADYYTDDEAVSVHEPSINGITSVGIAVGDGRDTYDPARDITRAQMAGFIARTLAQLFDDDRDYSLFEIYSGFFAPASRTDAQRQVRTGQESELTFRNLQAGFLDSGVQLRLTLVTCDNVRRGTNDVVTFDVDGSSGLADAGAPTTRITEVNGGPPPEGSTSSSVAVAPAANGTIRVKIENTTGPECVVGALYVNGGPGKTLPEGGTSPRLEVDPEGRPVELFGISGSTTFAAAS